MFYLAIPNHTRPLAFAVGDSTLVFIRFIGDEEPALPECARGLILEGRGFKTILQTQNDSQRPEAHFTEPIWIVEPVGKNRTSRNAQ